MNELIRVRGFLTIKNADIEVKKFNVIIGPQANGKSLLAKLLYYFKQIPYDHFVREIRQGVDKRDLDKNILKQFELYFPRYSWEGSSFSIDYINGDVNVSIYGVKTSKNKTNLKLKYSSNLRGVFYKYKKAYTKKLDFIKKDSANRKKSMSALQGRAFYDSVLEPIRASDLSYAFSDSLFVPASRSFFANLQKNIFTFLASNIDIDPFLKEFGSFYETAKFWYGEREILEESKQIDPEIYKLIESIIGGKYEYQDDQDWIKSGHRRINLVNASSGQQEALPMLLTMCTWPTVSISRGDMLFIEEPEAHLFPTSQSYVVSILSLLARNFNTSFFITTHSPYVLSAINNLVIAYEEVVEKKKFSEEEFRKINGPSYPISINDISAYSMLNGELELVTDKSCGLIGETVLDSISDHFQDVINKLLV